MGRGIWRLAHVKAVYVLFLGSIKERRVAVTFGMSGILSYEPTLVGKGLVLKVEPPNLAPEGGVFPVVSLTPVKRRLHHSSSTFASDYVEGNIFYAQPVTSAPRAVC